MKKLLCILTGVRFNMNFYGKELRASIRVLHGRWRGKNGHFTKRKNPSLTHF